MEEIKKEIEAYNDFWDRRHVKVLIDRLNLLNRQDPKSRELINLAREKGII